MSASPRRQSASGVPFAVGAAALALLLIGGVFHRTQFFRSYLLGFLFWAGISLGSLAILMLYHLVGGKWGFLIRRLLEAGTRTLPVMAVLFVPLLFGLRELFPWARPEVMAADPKLLAKHAYLNAGAFIGRAAIVFALWIVLARLLNRWSEEQDRTGDPGIALRLQRLSAPGLVVYGLTTFFASVDWLMSLDPLWYSTIFGMMFMVSHGLTTMAFVILAVYALSGRDEVAGLAVPGVLRDLGNLLFMFVMLWAYMAFSQLIIVWSGNLPEEITWYMPRLRSSWELLSLALLVFYFGTPFLLLLSRRIKENLKFLASVAALVLVMRVLDLVWLIEPIFHPKAIYVHWMDLAAPVGIGGIWLGAYLRLLGTRPLIALHDNRVEGLAHHG